MKFQEMTLPNILRSQLLAKNYHDATAVQQAMLNPSNAEGDLVVSSQTGSGKTVAFGLACASVLLDENEKALRSKKPAVLVVAPTRELALQVARELMWLYAAAGVRVASCVGGMDIRREQQALGHGAQVVVGTPGRLCDHIERGFLALDNLAVAVLDEADEMLDMGFRDELGRILDATPAARRTLLFSATMPKAMEALAKTYTKDAKRIAASSMAEPHKDIEYVAYAVAPRERDHAVVNVLRYFDAPSALVFCARRDQVTHMQASLVERGFTAEQLSGELSQAERNRALLAMREGRARVLVATDVAARGLDLPQVGLVVHADLPQNPATLQHRSGRTGRAGRKGTAVLLAPFPLVRVAERLAYAAKISLQWKDVPKVKDIRALDQKRLLENLGTVVTEVEPEDLDVARELLSQHSPEFIAAALVRVKRQSVPAAEELPLTAARAQDRGASRAPAKPRRDDRPPSRAEARPPRGRDDRPPSRAEARPPRAKDDRPVARGEDRPPRGRDDRPPARHEDRPPSRRDDRPPSRKDDRPPSRGSAGRDQGVWFRVNIGREKSADPRWLLPMLCRRGNVTKRDIGRIEISARETRFEINPEAAENFATASGKRDKKDPAIRIEPVRG